MKTLALALALTALAPLGALAQDVRGADEGQQVTTHTFTDADDVRGDRLSPAEELLRGRTRRMRETLIRAREHFRPELLRSVEVL